MIDLYKKKNIIKINNYIKNWTGREADREKNRHTHKEKKQDREIRTWRE